MGPGDSRHLCLGARAAFVDAAAAARLELLSPQHSGGEAAIKARRGTS